MSVATAEKNGMTVVEFAADSFIPEKQRVGNLAAAADDRWFVAPGGQTMSLRDAIDAGLVSEETTLRVDGKSGRVSVADQSHGHLVDAFVAFQSVTDWLDDVERRLSAANGTCLDDAASVQREMTALKVMDTLADYYFFNCYILLLSLSLSVIFSCLFGIFLCFMCLCIFFSFSYYGPCV